MGKLSHGTCFGDALEAERDYFSRTGVTPTTYEGSPAMLSWLTSDYLSGEPGTLALFVGTLDGVHGAQIGSITLPDCTPVVDPYRLSAADGALVASAVASVWIAGACWRYLARALGTRSED